MDVTKSFTMPLLLLLIFIAHPFHSYSANPIITHMRTADPSIHIWADGRVWLYCSHDMDSATDYSTMDGYHVFSSTDLVTWVDHGEAFHSRDVGWGISGYMWAPDCAFKNGTYYFYYPHLDKTRTWKIGVATSTKPEGPFRDIGNPITRTYGTDPCCFIDTDGQAYLYYGEAMMAKLKPDMMDLAETPRKVNYGASNHKEGVFVTKIKGVYYYTYTDWTDPVNQGYYSTGSSPYGPFTYKGPINKKPSGAQDHHSFIEYQGKWYYFYHVGNYTASGIKGSANRRNVCIDEMFFNSDGTIKMIIQTATGVGPVTPVSTVAPPLFDRNLTQTPASVDNAGASAFNLQGRRLPSLPIQEKRPAQRVIIRDDSKGTAIQHGFHKP